MAERRMDTAVGAGTLAGDARDEEEAPESRAAEAATDGQLESLRVTGAGLTGAGGPPPDDGRPVDIRGAIRPEAAREDLAHNQAGIASRVPGVTPKR
jgi:hypothetical protein